MAKQRTIPFGYRMEMGKIVCHPTEAETVKQIFAQYLLGNSMQQIAQRLTEMGTCYHSDVTEWNKNMVKRILENPHYLGDDR